MGNQRNVTMAAYGNSIGSIYPPVRLSSAMKRHVMRVYTWASLNRLGSEVTGDAYPCSKMFGAVVVGA